jgi:hypothetical protein
VGVGQGLESLAVRQGLLHAIFFGFFQIFFFLFFQLCVDLELDLLVELFLPQERLVPFQKLLAFMLAVKLSLFDSFSQTLVMNEMPAWKFSQK